MHLVTAKEDGLQDNDKPVARQVGARVARLRRTKGWKQRELAGQIGCSLQQVSKMERGCYAPRASIVVRLAEALDVTADYLLTGKGPRKLVPDPRLRERLPALEGLPEPQRDSLVLFLDALIMAHRFAGSPFLPGGPAGGGEGGPRR
jgi:transcriptional regulator with XRE-family HTH domain